MSELSTLRIKKLLVENRLGRIVAILVMSTAFFACSGTASLRTPGWINHLYDTQYTEVQYLCAVGSGSNREVAAQAALGGLSQVFNAEVRSLVQWSVDSTTSELASGEVEFQETTMLSDSGSITSNAGQIIGAEIVNTWIDSTGTVWVRAAVDRKRSAVLYEQKLQEIASQVSLIRLEATRARDPFSTYLLLRSAWMTAREHQGMAMQLQVLTGKQSSNLALMQERAMLEAAASLQVYVDAVVQADEKILEAESLASVEKQLTAAYTGMLASLGLVMVQDPLQADATLSCTLRLNHEDVAGSPYRYVQYHLEATLTAGGTVVHALQISSREAGMSVASALRTALREALGGSSARFLSEMTEKLAPKI